jgi:Domain of unknown function (DUF1929)/Glyoxal oxidase N-terminus/Concanavalin A-like lectin/glucanases superfamily
MSWETVGRSGVVATAAALLHTGQLIFFARPEDPPHAYGTLDNGLPGDASRSPTCREMTLSTVVNIAGAEDLYTPIPTPVTYNPFCAGLTHLADGRLLVAGGDKKDDRQDYPMTPEGTRDGRRALRVFVPHLPGSYGPGEWRDIGRISDSRWYPTCTLLPDGRVFIASGYLDDMVVFNNQNPTSEIIPPVPGGRQYLPPLVEAWPYDAYPFVFTLPSGSVFLFAKDSAYFLDGETIPGVGERWRSSEKKTLPKRPSGEDEPAKQYPNTATAVLLPLRPENGYADAEVLIVGGGGENVHPQWDTLPSTADPTFRVPACDRYFRMRVDPPEVRGPWRRGQPRGQKPQARVMPDAVLLPDGTVLVVNGASHGYAGGTAGQGPAVPYDFEKGEVYAVLAPDLYDPVSDTWQKLEPAKYPRMYHSVALLLPDARVLIAGSDHQVNQRDRPEYKEQALRNYRAETFEYRMEAFTPPYLRKQGVLRPVIDPGENQRRIEYGRPFEIRMPNLDKMELASLRATLLKPGAVTHSNNMGQRCLELMVREKRREHLVLEAPPSSRVAPPGYYMLFVLNDGVPSEANFVRLPLLPDDATTAATVPRANLALWLRSDTGVIADSAGAATSWADLSGRGNDVFWQPSVGSRKPVHPPQRVLHGLNGYPVLRFSLYGTWEGIVMYYGACLQAAGEAFLPGSGDYTIFTVVHVWPPGDPQPKASDRDGGWGDLLGWGDFHGSGETCVGLRFGPGPRQTPDPKDQLPLYPGSASLVHYRNPDLQFVEGDSPALVPLSAAVLLEVIYDGAGTEVRINGEELHADIPTGPRDTSPGPLVLGQNGPNGAFFRGDVAEVLIYEQALSTGDRHTVREYLRTRYNLW